MIFANTTQVAAVPLRAGAASPLAVRNDEEEGEDEDGEEDGEDKEEGKKGKKCKKQKDEDGDEDEDGVEPVEIDVEGFEGRIVVLPAEAGNCRNLRAAAGKVSEYRLRNLAWIEAKRRRVEEASGGRVGYLFVPDTAILGHTELIRQLRPQFHLPGRSLFLAPSAAGPERQRPPGATAR